MVCVGLLQARARLISRRSHTHATVLALGSSRSRGRAVSGRGRALRMPGVAGGSPALVRVRTAQTGTAPCLRLTGASRFGAVRLTRAATGRNPTKSEDDPRQVPAFRGGIVALLNAAVSGLHPAARYFSRVLPASTRKQEAPVGTGDWRPIQRLRQQSISRPIHGRRRTGGAFGLGWLRCEVALSERDGVSGRGPQTQGRAAKRDRSRQTTALTPRVSGGRSQCRD